MYCGSVVTGPGISLAEADAIGKRMGDGHLLSHPALKKCLPASCARLGTCSSLTLQPRLPRWIYAGSGQAGRMKTRWLSNEVEGEPPPGVVFWAAVSCAPSRHCR